jgi:hypothetical protein
MLVADLYSVTPVGNSPLQLGPVTANVWAVVPVFRVPGTSNTSVQPSSSGTMKYRSSASGMARM